jgi:hypothetical protein
VGWKNLSEGLVFMGLLVVLGFVETRNPPSCTPGPFALRWNCKTGIGEELPEGNKP